MKDHALGREGTLQQIRELKIKSESNPGEEFEDDDFRTKPAPDRTEFETDGTAANDDKLLRRFFERKGLSAAHDDVAIEFHVRQFNWNAAGRDNNVVGFDLLSFACLRFDRDTSRRRHGSQTLKGRDLVSLH